MVSSMRNSLHRRSHRERAQPASRAKLGILEKKKDYVARARAYHLKQDHLKRLQVKAQGRNKDEFYFAMNGEKTNRGVHVKVKENASLTTEIAVVLKSQDANYIRSVRKQGLKQIDNLKAQLTALADLVSSVSINSEAKTNSRAEEVDEDEDEEHADSGSSEDDADKSVDEEDEEDERSDTEEDGLRTLDPGELAILRGAGVLPPPRQASKRWEKATKRTGHIVFVDDERAARMYKPPRSQGASLSRGIEEEEPLDLGWILPDNRKGKERAAEEARQAEQTRQVEEERMIEEAKKHRSKLLKELAARLERDKHLRYAEQELQMQRLTMAGKGGHRKLRDPEKMYQGTGEEEDEFTFRRKGQMPVMELGNEVYKPKVVKWRQERKR
ncbi:hypothetical protein FRB95_010056 [Tulasnella sp. JGI-2019a]|nr:hypothetical protein FRB93_006598 [Tulasnella sp. JGI-2019a]KAG9025569.1 hypothetical protein FRB95_010056 [Tulasnella sp. JGI-2019a]